MFNPKGIFRILHDTPCGVYEDLSNMMPFTNPQQPNVNPVTAASVAGTQPITYYATVISGSNQITAIKVPAGFRGVIALRPTGAFTGATGGTAVYDGVNDTIPIGLAFTAVVGKILYMWTDGLLFYPSYTS